MLAEGEVRGRWRDLRIGTKIRDERRKKVWEVMAARAPQQIEHGMSLWVRVVNVKTGEEMAIPPRPLRLPVTIVEQPTDAAPLLPDGTEELDRLVEGLGARLLATKDNATGEWTCETWDYIYSPDEPGGAYREHLQLAHGIDGQAIDTLDTKDLVTMHGQAHDPRYPTIGKGGVSHRHVPESL